MHKKCKKKIMFFKLYYCKIFDILQVLQVKKGNMLKKIRGTINNKCKYILVYCFIFFPCYDYIVWLVQNRQIFWSKYWYLHPKLFKNEPKLTQFGFEINIIYYVQKQILFHMWCKWAEISSYLTILYRTQCSCVAYLVPNTL